MNSQQLHCFICVADKLNFTKAAEELFLSVPTVTHHIKALEEELHTQLFFRNSKIVRLTEAGTVFYNDAKEIVIKMEVSQKNLQTLSQRAVTFLRIGCVTQAELERLSFVLSDIKQQFPSVLPRIFVHDYFTLKTLFKNNQIDLMIVTREMIQDMKNCFFTPMTAMNSLALLPQNHPFANRDSLTFDELSGFPLITLHPKAIPFQYDNRLQEKIHLYSQKHIHTMTESDSEAILLAKSGYGIAILPEFSVPALLPGLSRIPISEGNPMEYGIAAWEKTPLNRFFITSYEKKKSINAGV